MKNLLLIVFSLLINFSCSPDPCKCGEKAADTYYLERLDSDCTKEAYKNNLKWMDNYKHCYNERIDKLPNFEGSKWLKPYYEGYSLDTLKGKRIVLEFYIDQKQYQTMNKQFDLYKDYISLSSERYFETLSVGSGLDCQVTCSFSKQYFVDKWKDKNLYWVRVVGTTLRLESYRKEVHAFGMLVSTKFNTVTLSDCEILEYR